jgi:hypothetical protein
LGKVRSLKEQKVGFVFFEFYYFKKQTEKMSYLFDVLRRFNEYVTQNQLLREHYRSSQYNNPHRLYTAPLPLYWSRQAEYFDGFQQHDTQNDDNEDAFEEDRNDFYRFRSPSHYHLPLALPFAVPPLRPIPTLYFLDDMLQFDNQQDALFRNVLDQSFRDIQPPKKKSSSGKTLVTVDLPTDTNFQCSICLEKADSKLIVKLPCCKQFLHEACCREALKNDERCALCRQVIP